MKFKMGEFIDILTKDGENTGESTLKSIIHKKGYYHNTAHVWFYTEDGDVLLAQRSASKLICPLLWDVSVAGHVDAGETIENAALRETMEELGILILERELQKIGVFECFQSYTNGIIDNEFHHVFIAKISFDISKLQYNTKEVENIKLVSLSEFRELLSDSENNGHFIKSNSDYYFFILDAIEQILKLH